MNAPTPASQPAASVSDLRVNYGTRVALAGVTFDVPEGSLFGLLGPNGGGKTTLFRTLATLMKPTGGTARVAGFDVATQAAEVRRRIGVVFQSPSLDKMLSVEENLRCQGALYGVRGAELSSRVDDMLERLHLTDRRKARTSTLSGGLKRRAEIAKGLLHRPSVLLLDEPTVGLDPGARRDVWDHLLEMRSRHGTTALVTTHLMEEAEKCDRLVILAEGRVVAEGAPDALRAEIGGDVVTAEVDDAEATATRVTERFRIPAEGRDGRVRIEMPDGKRFIPELIDAFPKEIRSVTLGKPTLEDVFLKRTGRRFFGDAAPAAPEGKGRGR